MTWDPYDMPRAPGDPEDKGDRWPPPAGTPANVRTVLLVFAAMVLLALTFSTAANAQQGGSEQQEAQTQEAKAQDPNAQAQETQGQETQAQDTQGQPTEAAKAVAQAKQEPAQTGAESAEEAAAATPLEGQFVEQPEDTYAASDLIGRSVYSHADEEIGPISDLLATESNRIVGVVIGVGGFLGIGEKPVAVKMDRLQRGRSADGDEQLVLNYSRQELERAPQFVSLEEKRNAQARQQQQAEAQQQQDSGAASGNATQE